MLTLIYSNTTKLLSNLSSSKSEKVVPADASIANYSVKTGSATKNSVTTSSDKTSKIGEELLLSFLMWENKYEEPTHEIFEDPIEVFLTAQGAKTLTAV